MRIAYGVMGYGRGHAMRSAAVLPALLREHEVTVFAGGDAYDALAPQFPTERIPTLGYVYGRRGHSLARTVAGNFRPALDLLLRGAHSHALDRRLQALGVELVISDSEAWTHQAAQRLGLPRISFDHVGIIAWCKPHFPPDLWLAGLRDGALYRALMGQPQRILISSFYRAEPARSGVTIVPPLLRPVVVEQTPRAGNFLLCYLNQGAQQLTPQLERTLRLLELPVVIYGTPRRGLDDHLDFRAPSESGFVQDLAGCRAVIATAGNQLIGEALHFGKPILTLPEDAFEQRLNAYLVERMGVGMRGDLRSLTPSDVDRFLGDEVRLAAACASHAGDGRAAAVDCLLRDIDELRSAARGPVSRRRRSARG
jgi:Glycosyl transferases, related to UDP-glucuronosyltransferase